jgi:hypothetical protein
VDGWRWVAGELPGFGTSDWDIDPSYFYIARPWAPVDWLPW